MSVLRLCAAASLLVLAACEIPAVDPTYISEVPADARSFARAQKAVRACVIDKDRETALKRFRQAGFDVSERPFKLRSGKTFMRAFVTDPDDKVFVLFIPNGCYVGLRNMTPAQSVQLAQRWVRAFDAKSNAEIGDGLSDHVAGAWRHFFTEPGRLPEKAAYDHRVYIAAYKTWPQGPYDPQRLFADDLSGLFPEAPGAAIRLNHVASCQLAVKSGPWPGKFSPCPGPTFRPH